MSVGELFQFPVLDVVDVKAEEERFLGVAKDEGALVECHGYHVTQGADKCGCGVCQVMDTCEDRVGLGQRR